jgi:hypothetical protein
MPNAVDTLAGWAGRLLDRLAERPISLLAALLLANALTLPYAGFTHDSRLYAVQTAEKLVPGSYGDDLYLHYGSQDRYSIFTLLITPLARLIGLAPAFFCGYLLSKALFFWGALRLVLALVPDRRAAVLSLLLISISPLSFGGNEIFHLNESFLTPRLAACGMVFIGLEQILAGRSRRALLALAAALVLHPLMAVGGLLSFVLWWLAIRMSPRRLAALLGVGAVLAGAVLCCAPLAERLFGRIDGDWRSVLLDVCYFIRPADWTLRDWLRLAWAAIVLVAAARTLTSPARMLLLAVFLTALVGALGSAVAVGTDYLLLLQTSPYRTIWLLEFLAGPLAFAWAAALWRERTPAACLLAILVVLLATCDWAHDKLPALLAFLAVLPIGVVGWRGLARVPRSADWLKRSAVAALVITIGLLIAYDAFVVIVCLTLEPAFHVDIHPLQVLKAAPAVVYKLPLLAIVMAGIGLLAAGLGAGRRLGIACLLLCLGYQAGITAADHWDWYGERFSARYGPREFVVRMLRQHAASRQRPLTVYWPVDVRDVWFEADANSYFNVVQLSGCGFNRGTALEGQRRALLVRRFELAQARRYPPPEPGWLAARKHFYRGDESEKAPTAHDLLWLCGEEQLDFVVLEDALDGLPYVTDGHWYIYDCRQLRQRESTRDSVAAAARGREK